jgi:hypothetical protein
VGPSIALAALDAITIVIPVKKMVRFIQNSAKPLVSRLISLSPDLAFIIA